MMTETQALQFKAEVQQLLNILAHSLYTEREIFLRELLSNASDALHRLQFEMLTNHEVLDPDAELAIRVAFDEEAKTLTVSDTGIGMTREELIENLGTIAHSGATAFLKRLEEGQRPTDIIGQFGVGFYAVFMAADEVRVTSRSYRPDAEAWTWTSRGESTYTLAPADKADRGTVVEIQLKEDAAEFASSWRLEQIIKKHSDYVSFPIYVQGREEVANRRTALWRTAPSEVEAGAYNDFYRQLTLDPEEPLLHIHMITDAPVNLRALLYIPAHREQGPLRLRTDHGLKLYSKKILIQEYNKDLLPEYFRFVAGVVDSEDVPLNISRETVQSNRVMRGIQKALTSRLHKALKELAEESPADYARFWEEFGAFLKEGVAMNPFNHEDLLPLLRFTSSMSAGQLTTLAAYKERMTPEQEAIYYVLGDSLSAVVYSPHLDAFKARELEVLYLVDPLDGFMMQSLREYEGKSFKNVDDPELTLPDAPTPEQIEPVAQSEFDALVERCKAVLGDRVTEVRASKVLRDNPARLVSPESGPERDLQRVRRLIEEDYKIPPRLLELNRSHPLIQNLARLVETQPNAPVIDLTIEQLLANLLLQEGLYRNPAEMVPRLQQLLEAATKPV